MLWGLAKFFLEGLGEAGVAVEAALLGNDIKRKVCLDYKKLCPSQSFIVMELVHTCVEIVPKAFLELEFVSTQHSCQLPDGGKRTVKMFHYVVMEALDQFCIIPGPAQYMI